jgi:nicotinate dehydrogenase subunit B
MSANDFIEMAEPERYELGAEPFYRFEISRREFFKGLGGGLFVLLLIKGALRAQESGSSGRQNSQRVPEEIGAWLHIAEDGAVTGYTGKVEFGQNIRTSLSQVIAEELRVPLPSIKLVMGDTDLTPFDMGTFGSRTIPDMASQFRKVSAAAREALLDMAAESWKADRDSLVIADGKVTNRTNGQSALLGHFTRGQKILRAVTSSASTSTADQWKVAGKPAPKVDARAFVTGRHKYTSDMKLPGMLHAKVLRPPATGASLVSVDTRGAEAIAGVKVVRDGDFVGAAAPDPQTASRAIAAIRAEWKTPEQPSSEELFDYLKKNKPAAQEGRASSGAIKTGNIAEALTSADVKIGQEYSVSYIAHVPLEPRAAVAEWEADRLTVWTGTQRPFGVRSEIARAFRIPEDRVRVIVPDTGSGYGGKHTGETAIEAARLARAAGKPVKVVWTRQEEFNWAYFRPAGVIEVKSGARKDGTLTAWEYHNYNSGASAIRTLYDVPNQSIEFHQSVSPLRQGSYRGLAATANNFARESMMDELAHAVGMDPLEFRLKNLKDARLRAVLEASAKAFGWGKKAPQGRGYGIAGGFEKGGYVATCAEVAVDRAAAGVKIARVVTAFECGAIVNPDGLKNQVEGSIVMAIGGALFESVQFARGQILNASLSTYRVPRFSDVPVIETVLLDRKDLPSAGAGETPIIGLAPAVAGAIFDAVGVRLRALPMAPDGLKL